MAHTRDANTYSRHVPHRVGGASCTARRCPSSMRPVCVRVALGVECMGAGHAPRIAGEVGPGVVSAYPDTGAAPAQYVRGDCEEQTLLDADAARCTLLDVLYGTVHTAAGEYQCVAAGVAL